MQQDTLSRIDFKDDEYTVKQSAVRNKYTVSNSSGDTVLTAKQKLFKMKEEFPFTDPDGDEVFNIKAENIMDIAGDYAITDAGTGEKVAVLSKEFSILKHVWHIKNPEEEEIARIESRGRIVGLLRSLSDIFSLIPHKYTIEDAEGEQVGTIRGKLSLRDTYVIKLEDTSNVPKETVLAAAITVDALEGN